MSSVATRLLGTRGGRRVLGVLMALFGAGLVALTVVLIQRTGAVPRLLLGVGPFAVGFGTGVALAPGTRQPDGSFATGWLPLALGAAAVVAGIVWFLRP